MASTSNHLKQWKHNREFLPTILPKHADWIVTATFYTALHAVDALLYADNLRITNHNNRNDILINTHKYMQITRHYLPLYDLSRTVRYLADPVTWVPFEKISSDVFTKYLYPVERSVKKLLTHRNAINDEDMPLTEISLWTAADSDSN